MKNDLKTDGKKQKKNLPFIITALLLAIIIWFSISLSEQFYVTISIPLKIINIPDGYSIGNNVPETVQLRIKSRGWKILELQHISDPIFYASAVNDPGTSKINLKNSLAENGWLNSDIQVLEISPEVVPLNIDRTFSKILHIKSNINITFKNGYGLARPPVFTPDSLMVYGTKKSLEKMNFVLTAAANFEKTDAEFSTTIPLARIPGIDYEINTVECFFDVQKIVEREIENIPIEINNVPPDRKVVISPGQVNIGIHGGIDLLAKLQNVDFKVSIDYKDILNDTLGVLAPNVILPPYVEKIYLKPEFVKPIIKKY
jgi:hypothetical protein